MNEKKKPILGQEAVTDARTLGVTAPVRESGDIAGSGAITLVGPAGQIELTEGVIAAKRHIHADPASAAEMGVNLKQGYNGDLTSREAGSVGGQMVKKMIESYEKGMK